MRNAGQSRRRFQRKGAGRRCIGHEFNDRDAAFRRDRTRGGFEALQDDEQASLKIRQINRELLGSIGRILYRFSVNMTVDELV